MSDGHPSSDRHPFSIDLDRITSAARDTLTVRRVFGEAYERDGVTVVPVAKVHGSAGTGGGTGEREGQDAAPAREEASEAMTGAGGGGGFAVGARPVGVYVIEDGRVRWEPAVDANRLVLAGSIVAGLAVLTAPWLIRALRGRRR